MLLPAGLKTWFPVALVASLVLVSALAVVTTSFESRRLMALHQKLEQQSNAAQVKWGQLLLEQSTWGSYHRVEKEASTKLGMRVPEPKDIVMVEP